jgi:hypothetical protein
MPRLVLSLIAALLFITTILYVGGLVAGRSYGFDSPGSVGEWHKIALLASGTLIGLVSQVLIVQIRAIRTKEISIFSELKTLVRSKAFWIAGIASPLVLISAYKSLGDVQGDLMVFFLSYQNGFFWNSIIAARSKGQD